MKKWEREQRAAGRLYSAALELSRAELAHSHGGDEPNTRELHAAAIAFAKSRGFKRTQ